MKTLRILYVVAMVLSLGFVFIFYYQYQLKNRELAQYEKLNRFSYDAFSKVSDRLRQTMKEIEKLNETIAALEKDNLDSQNKLQALKEEKERKIARLIEEKNILEKKLHSLEELKKAIRIARKEKHQRIFQRRLAKIEMLKRLDEISLRQGNRGYIVRQGASTFKLGTRIRVELEPLSNTSYKREE